MINFHVKMANRVVAISANYLSSKAYCFDYITEETPDFSVEITSTDLDMERPRTIRSNMAEGRGDATPPDQLLEITSIQRKIAERMFEHDTIVFHGSCVSVDGVAYLFTAKSGTGKSTHTGLWRQVFGNRAMMVNDDKPFLHIAQEGIFVYGSPWNGKHHLGNNICVPLKAICILERGEENRICRISAEEALRMLVQQSNRPARPALLPKYMELLDRLACSASFYRLQCNMEPEAAEIAFAAMSKSE